MPGNIPSESDVYESVFELQSKYQHIASFEEVYNLFKTAHLNSLWKMAMCNYANKCNRVATCSFAHNQAEIRKKGDPMSLEDIKRCVAQFLNKKQNEKD